jgi:hypothetical protein
LSTYTDQFNQKGNCPHINNTKTTLLENNIDECPRVRLLAELGIQLEDFIQQDSQIIVCGDTNEDVQGNKKSGLQIYNMSELIISQRGPTSSIQQINKSEEAITNLQQEFKTYNKIKKDSEYMQHISFVK